MCRREFLHNLNMYDKNLRKKQDYDLWLRGSESFKYANLEDVLVRYTVEYSKPLISDLYGLYVRCLNAHRKRRYVSGYYWAFVAFGINVLTKIGYKQRSYKKKNV